MSDPGRYFTWNELIRSSTATSLGIDNTPNEEQQQCSRYLVADTLDPLRARLGRAVWITSGFRSRALNTALKGASSDSQHMLGEAVDIKVGGMNAVQLATFIVQSGLPFDQLIWYDLARGGHVHVSYTMRRANRRETLHAPESGGYVAW